MWIKKPSLAIPAGAKAGYLSPVGYFIVSFKGVSHLLHRLAWVLYTGEWPDGFIDHIDKDKLNNKISNLRVSSREQNGRNSNSRKNSSSKYLGVSWCKTSKKWVVQTEFMGKNKHLGRFVDEETAARAYDKFAEENYGEFCSLNFKDLS